MTPRTLVFVICMLMLVNLKAQNAGEIKTVYLRIIAGQNPVSVRQIQVIINDKALTTIQNRIEEKYIISPGDESFIYGKKGIDGSSAKRNLIKKDGNITYKIVTRNPVSTVNVITGFAGSDIPQRILIGTDPEFSKNFHDLTGYLVNDNRQTELSCMVNFRDNKVFGDGLRWRGTFFADRWGIPELWWYDMAQITSLNADFENITDNSTDFKLRARLKNPDQPGFAGVTVPWSTDLEKGYLYYFTFVTDSLPDYILINNYKVWDREDGYSDPQGQISFTYIPPASGAVRLCFIKEIDGPGEILLDLNRPGYGNRLYVTRSENKGVIPVYLLKPLPEFTTFTGINPSLACRQQKSFGEDRVEYVSKPMKLPEYAAGDMLILPRQIIHVGTPDLYTYLNDLGIRGLVAGGKTSKPGLPMEKLNVYKDLGIMHLDFFIGSVKENGNYFEAVRHMTGITGTALEERVKTSLPGLANEWLEMVPDGTVSIHFQEANDIFGSWAKDIRQSKLAALPQYSKISKASVPDAFRMHFEYLNEFISDIKKGIKPEFRERVKIMFLFDRAAYQGVYAFKSGADIFVTKQIHRQSVNILVSNARGSAGAYGKEYGFDCDTWDRCFYHSYHPEEAEQIMKVYYHAGGKYLIDEMSTTLRDGTGITALGRSWLDFIRYAKRHPSRGAQQARIAVMRGFDEWHTVASPSASWESSHYEKFNAGQNYLGDFNLMNIFFSNFGRYDRTSSDRLCTGTPYGPVDMIPWDAPSEVMKKYGIVILLGVNDLDKSQLANFREYVRQGGILMLAAGHLKDASRNFTETDFMELFGVKIIGEKRISGKPYTTVIVSAKAEVPNKLPNGDPLTIRNKFGKGACYLLTGENVSEFGMEVPSGIIRSELEDMKWITFSPSNDKIEYMIQKKGAVRIFPVFNHGNIGFPSGNGLKSGPWAGSMKINTALAGLKGEVEAFRVIYNEANEDPYTLEKLRTEVAGNDLLIHIEIDRFEEIVVGPAGKVRENYFALSDFPDKF